MFRRLPISKKILLTTVPLFLLVLFLSVELYNYYQEREMMAQAEESAHTYAAIIKQALVSMMLNNFEVDESFLTRVNELQQFDTLHILVNDLHLRDDLLTERRWQRLETKYKALSPRDETERQALATGKPHFQLRGDVFRAVVPFEASQICQKCHQVPQGYVLGAADMHISLERIADAARANWIRSLLIFVGFTVIAIAFGSLMFRRIISQPVLRLVEATKAMSAGQLDTPIVEKPGTNGETPRDELAYLATRFEHMRESLKEKINQLDVMNRNLSEQNQEIEEALERLRAAQEDLVRSERLAVTGRMTAQLSHEINNPIHNIQSLLESSLRKINENEKARELIRVALEEVMRMDRLTRQMLDLYKDSVLEFSRTDVDVGQIIQEVVKTNQEAMQSRNILFKMDVSRPLPPIHGSPDKLKQVFANLLSNARDAMPEGGLIEITAVQETHNVRVVIRDTGTGIPREHLGRVFDAFFTTKKETSGVGLGLSVSYAIVQQHGGTIGVKSSVGSGTTFTIILPIVQRQ